MARVSETSDLALWAQKKNRQQLQASRFENTTMTCNTTHVLKHHVNTSGGGGRSICFSHVAITVGRGGVACSDNSYTSSNAQDQLHAFCEASLQQDCRFEVMAQARSLLIYIPETLTRSPTILQLYEEVEGGRPHL